MKRPGSAVWQNSTVESRKPKYSQQAYSTANICSAQHCHLPDLEPTAPMMPAKTLCLFPPIMKKLKLGTWPDLEACIYHICGE